MMTAQSCTGTGSGGCQQVSCPNGGTTSVSGTVFAPNGTDPLSNVLVYVPTTALTPFTDGVSVTDPILDDAANLVSGSPLAETTTEANGTFTLTDVPPGSDIPIVIQAGRWRRELVISSVASCTNTAVTTVTQGGFSSLDGYGESTTVRFAQTQGEGDIPKMALVTGKADALECSLRKVGIADTEFTDYTVNVSSGGTGPGRVNLFEGSGDSGAKAGSTTHTEDTLVGSTSSNFSGSLLGDYNVLLLPCQGDSTNYTTADGRNNAISFTGAGGRIFATHHSAFYINENSPIDTAANWTSDTSIGSATATINTAFSSGNTLAQWLQAIGSTTTLGQVAMTNLFNDQSGVNSPTQSWATLNSNSDVAQFSFYTPVGTAAADQFGRVMFNEYHVDNTTTSSSVTFPAECTGTMAKGQAMTSQEHMLEYSLFDLMNFAVPVTTTDVSISIAPSPSSFTGGDSADQLLVTVTNNGASAIAVAPTVTLTVTLPSGLTPTSMIDPLGNWSCNVNTLTCTLLNPLAASASNSVTVTVSVAANISAGTPSVGATVASTGFSASTSGSVTIDVSAAPPNTVTATETTVVTATNVGSTTTSAGTATFALSGGTVVSSILVVTEGYTGKDFTNAGSGTCIAQTYAEGSTCTVVVNFSPLYPGPRAGAIELLGSSNTLLATSYISGVGLGPEAIFQPGTQSSVASESGSGNFDDVVVDVAGNVYIADFPNHQILKETLSNGSYTQSAPFTSLSGPKGISIDGAGNIYIADTNASQAYKETLVNGSYTQTSIGSGLNNPDGIAVDAGGNVYIADSSNNRVLAETLSGGGYTQSTIANGLGNPWRVALDVAGDVYITDTGNNQVLLETLSNGAYTESTVVTGLNAPRGVWVDGNGTIYIADTGNNRVIEEQLVNGSYVQTVLVGGLNAPRSVTLDELGNLYIADFGDNQLYKQDYSDPPSLTFANTPPNVVSSDSPQTVTLVNFGNTALAALSPGITAPTDFPQVTGNSSDCTSSFSLIAAGNCALRIEFYPLSAGTKSESFVLTDNNLNSSSVTQTIAVSGTSVAITITVSPTSLPAPVVGTSYSQTLTASGGTSPYTFSIVSGSLPTGLSLSSGGVLSGTPTAFGNFNFTVQALDSTSSSDGGPYTGTRSYSIVVTTTLTVTPSSLPSGTVGTPYSQTLSASGGTSPYTFTVTSGSLPTGLSLSSSGVLSGTPTAFGDFSFTVQAQDSTSSSNGGPYTGTRTYSIVVSTTLAIAPSSLPGGTADSSYSQTLSASGGTSPYTFTVTSGSLPTGLSLSSGGVLSGAPTAAGTFMFTIQAQDSTGAGSGGPYIGTRAYSLTIAAPSLSITPATLPGGTAGSAYGQTLAASGGASPYTFSILSGSLPTGVSLSSSGVLSGTPTAAGSFTFTIQAHDSTSGGSGGPFTGTRAYSVTFAGPTIVVAPATLPNATVGSAYSQTVSASGGSGTYTYAVTSSTLPAGLTLNSTTGAITGTPTTAGPYTFTITASDTVITGPGAPYTGSQTFSFTVGQGTVSKASTTTTLASSSNPALVQSSLTFTASVSTASGTPTGSVTFLDGTTQLGSSTLSSHVATFTTSSLTLGLHSITAAYSGDSNYLPSTSSVLSESVINFAVNPVSGSGTGGSGSGSGSGGSQTVSPGGTAIYTIAITPTSGSTFPTITYLTVTGLPPGATAALSTPGWSEQTPTSWSLPAFATLSDVSLSFHVPASSAGSAMVPSVPGKTPSALALLLLLPLVFWIQGYANRRRWAPAALLVGAALVSAISLTGCGARNGFYGQQPASYVVTVTVTTGTLSHSTQVTLTVQ